MSFGPATDVHFRLAGQPEPDARRARVGGVPQATDGGSADAGATDASAADATSTVPVQIPDSVADPDVNPWDTAWALVYRATLGCGAAEVVNDPLPWSMRGQWFYFPAMAASSSCATRLENEQVLLCVADELSQISDAVAPVVMPALTSVDAGAFQYGSEDAAAAFANLGDEWIVPPQADSDRFVVRDMAIYVLGLLETLDSFTDISPASLSIVVDAGSDGSAADAGPNMSCVQAYQYAGTHGLSFSCTGPNVQWAPTLFGSAAEAPDGGATYPQLPPSVNPICTSSGSPAQVLALAQSAMVLEAQMLRAGGRLLHDLIRRDVYSDMAASAQSAAQAMDPGAASQLTWGVNLPPGEQPYGTLAHAARVLMGRWEVGDPGDKVDPSLPLGVRDPECASVPELDIVDGIVQPGALPTTPPYGPDFQARFNDIQLLTSGQQTAVQMVEQAGIVVPSCSIPTTASASDGGGPSASALRQALAQQLLIQQQVADNVPLVPSDPRGAIYVNAVGQLADGDIVFAFQRALRTWRLLTNQGDPACNYFTTATFPVAGLSPLPAAQIAPSISGTSMAGTVIAGGLSRARLRTDTIARAGGMLQVSQCADGKYLTSFSDGPSLAPSGTSGWTAWGSDDTATFVQSVGGTNSNAALPSVVFQDAFHIGQALERRLVLLDQAAISLGAAGTALLTGADPVARGGIAELKSWAGSTMVHAWPSSATTAQVLVEGILPADLGATALTPAIVQSSYGFVYGPPWVAECATGVRTDCPTNFMTTSVARPSNVLDLQASPFAGLTSAATAFPTLQSYGVLNDAYLMTVTLPASPTGATVPLTGAQPGSNNNALYMVLLHDPTSTKGIGRVMGTLPMSGTCTNGNGCIGSGFQGNVVNFVDAPMQRELLHAALDIGVWEGLAPPALADPPGSQPSGYCVDGVPRDVFVPLDNELISGTTPYEDSWQVYLGLAQTAAQTADTLGQQLIANDLQISENQQAAEEQLANICGNFGLLSGASVSTNGTVTAGAGDPSTASCLSETFVDVVFLGNLPAGIPPYDAGATAQTPAIKAALACDAGAPASAAQLCAKASLTADALGVVTLQAGSTAAPTAAGGAPACSSIVNNVLPSFFESGPMQATSFAAALTDPTFSPSSLGALLADLQLNVAADATWNLTNTSTAQEVYGTDPQHWPGCWVSATGCSGPGGLAGTVFGNALELAFRDCPNQALGACYATSAGLVPATAELNMIRWRLTQSLWMAAVSSGTLPAGLFNIPIPATFTAPVNLWRYTWDPGNFMRDYDGSLVMPSGLSGATLAPSSDTSIADLQLIGSMPAIASSFTQWPANAGTEVPAWYLYDYTAPPVANPPGGAVAGASPVHIAATNTGLVFPQCLYSPNGAQAACAANSKTASAPTPVPVSLESILTRASAFDGLSCANPHYGEPSGKTPLDLGATSNGPWSMWWEGVAVAKNGGVLPVAPALPGAAGCPTSNLPAGTQTYPAGNWDPSDVPSGSIQGSFAPSKGTPTRPSCFPPNSRAYEYVGHDAFPNGTCGAASLIFQTALLACEPSVSASSAAATMNLTTPPPIAHVSDIPLFEEWLTQVSNTISNGLALVYVQTVPRQVVTDFQQKTVGSGSLGGSNGQAVLGMEQDIQAFPTNWIQLSSDISQINSAIQAATLAINAGNLQAESSLLSNSIQQIGIQGNMASSVGAFMQAVGGAMSSAAGGFGTGSIGAGVSIAGAAIVLNAQLSTDSAQLAALQSAASVTNQIDQNQVAQALATLAQTTGPLWANIQTTLVGIRSNVAQLDADGQAVQLSEGQAAYQAAIGTGSDFVSVGGTEVPIPVDTVLRRQSSATLQRYQAALKNAKALAYMARRAIEQRIGVTLDSLTQSIGPLDPPASWADSICSLQGVNYSSLSTAVAAGDDGGGLDGAVDQAAISQYANGWVGDYVAKLTNFVTFYNVQYPSHQGDDTAVLSLRYDLLGAVPTCSQQASNLLLNSGDLSRLTPGGWQTTPCAASSATCPNVIAGYALAAPTDGPWGVEGTAVADAGMIYPSVSSGITWLSDVAVGTPTIPDAGSDASPADGGNQIPTGTSATAGWPNDLVAQQVVLEPGEYVLSWWDQARTATGAIPAPGSTVVPYVAEVFDPSWGSAAIYNKSPFVPAGGDASAGPLWSARHALSFSVANQGAYTIAFGASTVGSGPGNVAIADVQLELAPLALPSTYVATSDTTTVLAYNCTPSDSDLRSSFVHACDSTGTCWYDLQSPVIIDTAALNGGQSSLGAKLAQGNYNYRDIDLAVNLVGTNVHNCTNDPSPNCYGSGYIEYDLTHDATSAGIVGYDGNARIFDFGVASVNHGKALAAEQYLTMPLSSADQQLVAQPGIQHIEFGGRPLDGTYHLRIWDSPDLDWSQLQDIQIIFDYQYWTNIIANGNVAQVQPHKLKRAPIRPIIAPQRHRKSLARR